MRGGEIIVAQVQVTKIQMRRGPASDLPNPTLDDGEIGFTTDLGRLFIGQVSPTLGQPNYNRATFPFQNVEVLSENSPLDTILAPVISDNQQGFIISVPLIQTASFLHFQTYDSTNTPQDFYVDLVAGGGCNADVHYFVYDPSNNPIRIGRLHVVWNNLMVGSPLCTDEAEVPVGSLGDIQWTATLIGSLGHQHVVLEYINNRSDTPSVYFRLDRPLVP